MTSFDLKMPVCRVEARLCEGQFDNNLWPAVLLQWLIRAAARTWPLPCLIRWSLQCSLPWERTSVHQRKHCLGSWVCIGLH